MKTTLALWACLALLLGASAWAGPNYRGHTARPLRYRPVGTDFVIDNGAEFFNRPLYGVHSAFRIDGGDKPEWSLYLPGRGGNLRLGLSTAAGRRWLSDARAVQTRYRPGSLVYTVRDPLLGPGSLEVTALPMSATQGLILKVQTRDVSVPVDLVWAFGGANGQRGARDGDIGTERVPMSEYFQLTPDECRGNTFSVRGSDFTLRGRTATIAGVMPPGSAQAVADASRWSDIDALLSSAGSPTARPVLVGQAALPPDAPVFLGLQRVAQGGPAADALPVYQAVAPQSPTTQAAPPVALRPAYAASALPGVFDAAEQRRAAVAGRVAADTPDPFINAAASALCVASDGVWDEKKGAFMHGAVAWRTALLGWRGPYQGDELGWHDRTRRHLMNWLTKQDIDPASQSPSGPTPVPPDVSVRLARNEPALHTDGDLSHSHYDMNLVAIDVLFRHLLWTGDVAYARRVWPVIARHLAWERRLFRRPFGPDRLPLYEAYCCIWASDDLQYEGGGVAHASAYNYYHNVMAARIARLIGQNPAPYELEADLIHRAMDRYLWLPRRGEYAEWKDLLGLQLAHPSDALWTFYHTVDSQVPTPLQAWQMADSLDAQIPHIPITGPGIPAGDYFTLPTTTWMPYTWSTNNVVMAESAHTSLADWQAGRSDLAFRLFKGCLLDSMYQGLCPGNVGMCTKFDVARGESQRDFADGIGMTSRALVEGLFGVRPDALAGELTVRPGFPAAWDHAGLTHPDFDFSFRRVGMRDAYTVASRWGRPMTLRLQVPARRDGVASVLVNGRAAPWRPVAGAVGTPAVEIDAAPAPQQAVVIVWQGDAPTTAVAPAVVAQGALFPVRVGRAIPLQVADPQRALGPAARAPGAVRAAATGALGRHTAFVLVRQGAMTWWLPVTFAIRPAFEIVPPPTQSADGLRFAVRNNTPDAVSDRLVTFRVNGLAITRPLAVPAFGQTALLTLGVSGLVPGTNSVTLDLGGGRVAHGQVTDWRIDATETSALWDPVDLRPALNDRVTQIFKNAYLSPRSPYCSLAMPTQGIGSWIHWDAAYDVNDAGLRAASDAGGGRLRLPQGVPFTTPGAGDAKNVAFVSQWDNYPRRVSVPLSGRASHVYLLMAGSTNSMQSRFQNGEVVVTYADGTASRLSLDNPMTWWPIDQDYLVDDYGFRDPAPAPPRVALATGAVRLPAPSDLGRNAAGPAGGQATALDLPLDPRKELQSLSVRAVANEVVIGLLSATLVRSSPARP